MCSRTSSRRSPRSGDERATRGAERLDRRQLVFGIPQASFIDAAFSYWRLRDLNRFNGPGRGAWYAAIELETCLAEVSFHMERELANVVDFRATVEYSELYASFVGDFMDVGGLESVSEYLNPAPEKGYPPGNQVADAVRDAGHYGIVYPSVRPKKGRDLCRGARSLRGAVGGSGPSGAGEVDWYPWP